MRIRTRTKRRGLRMATRLSRRLGLAVIVVSVLALALPVSARNPNFRLCFRTVINVPGPNFGQPPIVDGIVTTDLGWTSAFRYVFGNGTPTADGIIQGIRDAGNLYLSFEVNNDQMFDNEDVIVLTLDPTGVAAAAHRFHIYPVFAGAGAQLNGDPREVDHWTNSAAWTSAPALPAGTVIKVKSAGVGPVAYSVEMKLPIAGYSIPAGGDFGLYVNMIRVSAVGQPIGTATEMFWPTDAPPIGLDLEGNTPLPATWGNATLAGTCNGVSIEPSDITTNQSPSSKIAFPPGLNVFNAQVHNNTVNAAGTSIAADDVKATFKIANFGIPAFGDWAQVPVSHNPTLAGTIPINSSSVLSTDGWLLTPAQVTQYTNNTHQCILAELDSTNPNTFFVQKSAWTNMNFGMASVAEFDAEISGRLSEKPPGGNPNHQFDIFVTTTEKMISHNPKGAAAGQDSGDEADEAQTQEGRDISVLTWVAHGCRRTGNFITIKKKRFEIVDRAGSYGYIVQHVGTVGGWTAALTGQGVKRVGNNLYTVPVPHGGAVKLHTRAEPRDINPSTQNPPVTKPPRKCGKAKTSAGGFILLLGVFGLGLIGYAPRRRRKGRRV